MAAAVSPVYVSGHVPASLEQLQADCNNPEMGPHEKIGRVYARAQAILREGNLADQSQEFFEILKLLGIEFTQHKSAETALQLFRSLFSLEASLPLNSKANNATMGIYFLSRAGSTPEFVFKIGAKRAATELLAAKQAHLMGLGDHVINGLYCALQNPPVDKEVELVEELWNGNEKVYTKHPQFVVGIVEPFLEDSISADPLLSYGKMLLVALAIGLRDGKSDGLKEGTLIDVDDCYTSVVDPAFQSTKDLKEKGIAPTDLPLLKDPLASTVLSLSQIAVLAEIANTWDVFSICEKVGDEPILYADSFAERQKLNRTVTDKSTQATFTIEEAMEDLMHPDTVDLREQTTILNEDQKIAIAARIGRLKKFIREKQKRGEQFAPIDMVYAVDPFSKFYAEAIEAMGRESIRGGTPSEYTGRSTPLSLADSFNWTKQSLNSLTSLLLEKSTSQHSKVSEEKDQNNEVEGEQNVYQVELDEEEEEDSAFEASGSEVDEADEVEDLLAELNRPRAGSNFSESGFEFGEP